MYVSTNKTESHFCCIYITQIILSDDHFHSAIDLGTFPTNSNLKIHFIYVHNL